MPALRRGLALSVLKLFGVWLLGSVLPSVRELAGVGGRLRRAPLALSIARSPRLRHGRLRANKCEDSPGRLHNSTLTLITVPEIGKIHVLSLKAGVWGKHKSNGKMLRKISGVQCCCMRDCLGFLLCLQWIVSGEHYRNCEVIGCVGAVWCSLTPLIQFKGQSIR